MKAIAKKCGCNAVPNIYIGPTLFDSALWLIFRPSRLDTLVGKVKLSPLTKNKVHASWRHDSMIL